MFTRTCRKASVTHVMVLAKCWQWPSAATFHSGLSPAAGNKRERACDRSVRSFFLDTPILRDGMAGGAHLSSRGSLHKESGGDSHQRSFAIKDDNMVSRIPVLIERSRSPERRGGAGEPAQVASRSELSTPFITKLENPETGEAGVDREPFPPSTENNGTRFSNRHARRGSQQVHSRASKRDVTNMSLAHLNGEPGNLGGLMELFFPPLNPMESNNRKLPGEYDRWGFGGGSRSGRLV
jgi:hypothetical protein